MKIKPVVSCEECRDIHKKSGLEPACFQCIGPEGIEID